MNGEAAAALPAQCPDCRATLRTWMDVVLHRCDARLVIVLGRRADVFAGSES